LSRITEVGEFFFDFFGCDFSWIVFNNTFLSEQIDSGLVYSREIFEIALDRVDAGSACHAFDLKFSLLKKFIG
jgi:hypothetical protein